MAQRHAPWPGCCMIQFSSIVGESPHRVSVIWKVFPYVIIRDWFKVCAQPMRGFVTRNWTVLESYAESAVRIFENCYHERDTVYISIAGTLGCVFIDNETQESGVTKCTTGEAWSAFSWHHSSVFHCQWTHNQMFLLLSHMLIWNAKSIFIYVMKYVWFHLKVGN